MASVSDIRNRLIDRLMAINNSDYLNALERMIDSSNVQESKISLTEEQKIMLVMSDDDIKNRKIVDHDSLNQAELRWLKER